MKREVGSRWANHHKVIAEVLEVSDNYGYLLQLSTDYRIKMPFDEFHKEFRRQSTTPQPAQGEGKPYTEATSDLYDAAMNAIATAADVYKNAEGEWLSSVGPDGKSVWLVPEDKMESLQEACEEFAASLPSQSGESAQQICPACNGNGFQTNGMIGEGKDHQEWDCEKCKGKGVLFPLPWVNASQRLPDEIEPVFSLNQGRKKLLSRQQLKRMREYIPDLLWLDESSGKQVGEGVAALKEITELVYLKSNNEIATKALEIAQRALNKMK